ncbi:MAG: hypothetical protein HQM13_23110 [SAR324 cluster bacterium]|nr:hypothetical protein [SAR324 cluster bacterium]
MHYNNSENWYVLRIRTKFNQLVERSLTNKQFEVFNPTYQEWSRRKDRKKLLTKPIFNGYMFFRALLNPEVHLEVLKTLGVIQLLHTSHGPTPVPDEQIENVRLLSDHVGQCFHSPEFAEGDWVCIQEGPLQGLVGRIDRVNKKLLRLSIDSIPGSIAIEVNPEHVERLEKDPVYSTLTNR